MSEVSEPTQLIGTSRRRCLSREMRSMGRRWATYAAGWHRSQLTRRRPQMTCKFKCEPKTPIPKTVGPNSIFAQREIQQCFNKITSYYCCRPCRLTTTQQLFTV